jgi:ketosteroid isomerase-like protein
MGNAAVETNVELFQRGVEANNRGDVEALQALAARDIVIWALRSPVDGEYRGHDGIRKMHADNRENFDVWRLDYPDVRDLGDGRVLAIGTLHIRGRGGGVETDVPTAGVATFANGKMTRWHDYGDPRKALAAAGLES